MSNQVAPAPIPGAVLASAAGEPAAHKTDAAFEPGTALNITSNVEISISCRNLANVDIMSKSDPICVVLTRPFSTKKWDEILRTEIMENNLNPDYVTKLELEYRFEVAQYLRFEIYDIDDPDDDVDKLVSIGVLECTLGAIVTAGPRGYTAELESMSHYTSNGTMTLVAEELIASKDEIYLKISGQSLGTWMDCWMVKSFFTISKINDAGVCLVVHRSKEVRGSNPFWEPLTIHSLRLCNANLDRQLKIEAWKISMAEEDELIGMCFTTVNRMTGGTDERLQLMDKKGNGLTPTITVINCTVTPVHTFLDYIQAGTKIHLCFCIDFTSSNGNPNEDNSLHFINPDPKILNPYEQAIGAAGNVIKDYERTNIFPAFGFGARIPPDGEMSDMFPLNLGQNPNCRGVDGVLRAYKRCLNKVMLYGPTNFAPIINLISDVAEDSKPGQHYYILLIVTDGVITDIYETLEAIIRASLLPVSLVIVGVGNLDFAPMQELDCDGKVIKYNHKVAARDIVQFVEYRSADSWMQRTGESIDNPKAEAKKPSNKVLTPKTLQPEGKLAEAILQEIPAQLTSFMKLKDITPYQVVKEDPTPSELYVEPMEDDEVTESEEEEMGDNVDSLSYILQNYK